MAAGSMLPEDVQGDAPQMSGAVSNAGAAPTLSSGPTPVGGIGAPGAAPAPQANQPGIENPPGKGQLDTGTPPTPEYDQKKLAKVQTTLQLLDAMKPKSRTEYMDWWQQQHGDIDQHFNNMKKQLGDRPPDEQPTTKKEKFAALLQFGLHLMANSRAGVQDQGHALTSTLGDSINGMDQAHQAGIQKQQQQYDTQANAIEQGRAAAQKGIGSQADAMKGQETQDKDEASETKNNASAFKSLTDATTEKASSMGAPTYSTDRDGTIHSISRDAEGNAVAKPVLGIDGKPYKGRVLGRTTGSGIDKGDTAQIKNQKYLSGVLGLDDDKATTIAFKPRTGNPNADHKDIYKSIMSATMGDEDKAKRGADQYIVDNYGAGALSKANGPIVPVSQPPAPALKGLTQGKITTFANGQKWTLDIHGKPRQVSGNAIENPPPPQTPQ